MSFRRTIAGVILSASVVGLLAASATAQSWQVLSADYGAGGRRSDVTQRVLQLLGSGDFRVSNEALGGDPAPHQRKMLVLHARTWNGQQRDFSYNEGDTVQSSIFSANASGRRGDWDDRRGWQLVDAQYGVGNRWLNVTAQVQDWIEDRRSGMIANNSSLQVYDPAPGVVKTLVLHARERDGDPRELRFRDGETVDLSGFFGRGRRWSELRILNARYGAGSRTTDQTARLQGLVSSGSLVLHVNNDNMGGDPAPGQRKTLYVTYQYGDDSPQGTTVDEGGDLRLQPSGCPGPNCGVKTYHGVLAPEWQQKFDSYYGRWLGYLRDNNGDEVSSMEKRMRDIMRNYNIPLDTPFKDVASPGIGGER